MPNELKVKEDDPLVELLLCEYQEHLHSATSPEGVDHDENFERTIVRVIGEVALSTIISLEEVAGKIDSCQFGQSEIQASTISLAES